MVGRQVSVASLWQKHNGWHLLCHAPRSCAFGCKVSVWKRADKTSKQDGYREQYIQLGKAHSYQALREPDLDEFSLNHAMLTSQGFSIRVRNCSHWHAICIISIIASKPMELPVSNLVRSGKIHKLSGNIGQLGLSLIAKGVKLSPDIEGRIKRLF